MSHDYERRQGPEPPAEAKGTIAIVDIICGPAKPAVADDDEARPAANVPAQSVCQLTRTILFRFQNHIPPN